MPMYYSMYMQYIQRDLCAILSLCDIHTMQRTVGTCLRMYMYVLEYILYVYFIAF